MHTVSERDVEIYCVMSTPTWSKRATSESEKWRESHLVVRERGKSQGVRKIDALSLDQREIRERYIHLNPPDPPAVVVDAVDGNIY